MASLARGAAFAPAGPALPRRSAPAGRPGPWCWPWPRPGRARWRSSTGPPNGPPAAAALAGPAGSVVPAGEGALAEAVGAADLVVNATPVGMAGASPAGARPVAGGAAAAPDAGQVAADLVYAPRPDALAGRGGRGGRPRRRRARACSCTRRRRSWCCGRGSRSGRGHVARRPRRPIPPESRGLRRRDGSGRGRGRRLDVGRPERRLGQRLERRLAQRPGQRVALRRDGEQRDAHGDRRRVGATAARPRSAARCSARRRRGSVATSCAAAAITPRTVSEVGGGGTGQGEVDDGARPARATGCR